MIQGSIYGLTRCCAGVIMIFDASRPVLSTQAGMDDSKDL
jgi:hypothetical protein